ncbi:hypothetical protein [Silvibacterium acidisoli]|uniref:hypothetical protein n=1 Tax=Acidobacteriaceae bacterium ZG23-2 TaxID=2883246 RepID=UPI00406BEACC
MKIGPVLVACTVVFGSSHAYSAGAPRCKDNPKIVAACFMVHGRLSAGADTIQIRLWPIGTKRMLGVSDGPAINDAEHPIYPKALRFPDGNGAIYGDFEVCPFTPKRDGEMQFVCIESASHVIVKQ